MGRVQERSIKEKAKARKSGPSVLQKTKDLGVLANVFAATVHWDPTHRCHRVAVHLPEGETVPDIADALTGSASQQPQRQSRRLLQSAQSNRRKERQLASRRNARRRPQYSSQPPFSTPADPYVFPDTSADEAGSDSRSRTGGSARHKRGVSGSVGAAEGEEPRDLQHAPGHSAGRAPAPILTSVEPSDPCQGHESIAMNMKPENSMPWIGDTSWDSFLDNMFTDDHTPGRRLHQLVLFLDRNGDALFEIH
ncbi:hypothetical protein HRG_001380 [Hirsutella rhossiliensis]|uniref:Uncharacterized protein n=1 Tax=Hirsutella rhossiliensis TaxID=111463 RepID=A0A9P8N5A2_9HYPO|nr:uncharacterized protein HRG_01380 [Hirsutella rhossiliensis]KAH0968738.1 hypothetical protein HRG_01380 [Hirsutella rhossiliensis]